MKKLVNSRVRQLIVLCTFFIALLIAPTITWAQGEQYAWIEGGRLLVKGGSLVETVVLNPPSFSAGNQKQYSKVVDIRVNGQICQLTLYVNVQNDSVNSGNVFARTIESVGNPGSNFTPSCSRDVTNQYSQVVPISGSPNEGTTPETAGQKNVHVTITSPNGAAAPGTLTVKAGNQSKVITKTISSDTGSAFYTTDFLFEPGTYQICATPILTCQTFTKVKYQALNLRYGETAVSLDVDLTVTIVGFSQQSCSIGPYDVVLNQNGKTIQTIKSTSATTQPPKGSENTFGSEVVDTTAYLHAKFTKVIPGTYQVCAPRLKACIDYTHQKGVLQPKVELKGHESDSVSRCIAPGEPSVPPLPVVQPPPCAPGQLVKGVCKSFLTAFGTIDTNASSFLLKIFAIALAIAGGLAILLIMRAGYIIMTSAGNGEQVKKGREQLVAAIVGLLFIIFSFVILEVIGIDILRIKDFMGAGQVAPLGTCTPGQNTCTNGYVCNYNNGTGQCVKATTP